MPPAARCRRRPVGARRRGPAAAAAASGPRGGGATGLEVAGVAFHPPGAEAAVVGGAGAGGGGGPGVSLALAPNSLGLIYGRSGSGKTTLLHMIAGLLEPSAGAVRLQRGGRCVAANERTGGTSTTGRQAEVGIVFQFPDRHFLGDTVAHELAIGWPLRATQAEQQRYYERLQAASEATGLGDIDTDLAPWELSGGYQRRLAITVQLMRLPSVLVLDEPLAGLDYASRRELVEVLRGLKERLTILAVSHDVAELIPIVDSSWEMKEGGALVPMPTPMEPAV